MSTDPREAKAQRWLNEQIEQLKALRTSNIRDTEFKQWRQSTLTMIQRTWAGDSKRSARFRRIPFSPPSSQASMREAREYYERGCAEAAQLLKSYLDEISESGIPEATEAARPATLDPGMADDDFPTLDLPGGPAPAAPKPEPAPNAREPKKGADAPAGGVSVRGDGRKEEGGARRPERRKRQTRNGPRRRLRDMLGLDALEKLGRTPESSEPRMPGIDHSNAPPDPEPQESAQTRASQASAREEHSRNDDAVEAMDAHEAPDAEEAPAEPDAGNDVEVAPVRESDAVAPGIEDAPVAWFEEDEPAAVSPQDEENEAGEEAGVPFTADEFLSASPIFHTEGKPVRRPKREAHPEPVETDFGPAPLTSGTAIAVAAIASEVARLGVPEGHRARTRATLVNLAQMIEDGTMDWDGLRNAFAFAMEFPPIGRRLVPLLIPFLDQAA